MSGTGFVDRSWISADGLHLHARDYEAAPGAARLPVICLHGLTRNARDFDVLAPWLAERGRRVLAVDVRGRGLSQWDPAANYLPEIYAQDVERLALALGISRAVFVGTSMGGLITMEIAATRPDLVAAAVINDVGPVFGEAGIARITAYAGKTPSIAAWSDAELYLRQQNAHALPHYETADWAHMARRMFQERDGRISPDYDPAIARPLGSGSGALPVDPWQRWGALATDRPILLLRGSLSDLLDPEVAEEMVAGRTRAVLRIIDNVGHAPMLDEPDALDALALFFGQVD
jgi:pimeloyl-ACP methyl ester carboxylesterase